MKNKITTVTQDQSWFCSPVLQNQDYSKYDITARHKSLAESELFCSEILKSGKKKKKHNMATYVVTTGWMIELTGPSKPEKNLLVTSLNYYWPKPDL